ncbi:VOC family protein [Novosphingobium sp. 9U]|uniref:VOC family protein n=1 Tax=Novosphingobium sp. 9U TaxID=2653158 RepID=UPI0012F46D74|nr:VOC family protein [Novosphingobium sp. 9U]VWX50637.1 Glyoxalase [Novosphingobium sp. 9U]
MVSYATVGSNNLKAARSFYDHLLGSIELKPLFEHPSGGQVYGANGKITFAVLGPYDGMPATVGNGTMIGFALGSAEAVDAFHALAVQLGGRDEGWPGKRGGDSSPFYMSYFRDLDGNKISAFHVEGTVAD